MTRKTILVHAVCGTRMGRKSDGYCPTCRKWLYGIDAQIYVYKDTGKPVKHQQNGWHHYRHRSPRRTR